MVMPGEEIKNRRHVFTVSGLPAGLMVVAVAGLEIADRVITSDGTPSTLIVEHGHQLPGWKNRGNFLDFEEGQMVEIMEDGAVSGRVLGTFPYRHGGMDSISVAAPVEEAPVDLAAGDMVDHADPALLHDPVAEGGAGAALESDEGSYDPEADDPADDAEPAVSS